MGVTGLWKLIETSGKPVPLETLEGKVLAVDISIWLHQVVKGYQDGKGGNIHNAHIAGLFNRICKLLYFRIKPVFVFDGEAPMLKKMTIKKRAEGRSKIQTEKERIEHLLLQSLVKEKIVIQALGDPEKILSPTKSNKIKPVKKDDGDEIFKLPEIKEESVKNEEDEEDETCPKQSYDFNIHKIDINSSHFRSLPADVRHDILFDIKETRKQSNWARLRELPAESNDFSNYQMSRLLKRRQVQVGLEEAEKEMGGKTWSLAELESLLTEDGVLKMDNTKREQKIASSEHARFILVRDIANAMDEAKKKEEIEKNQPKPSTSSNSIKDEIEEDEDFDLQRAIQLSLMDDEPDEVENSDERIKLNANQRQKFGTTIQTHGLIRGFMMEYAEMNDDDIKDLMEATQVENQEDTYRSKFPHLDDYVLNGTQTTKKDTKTEVILSDSEDDEFVDIPSTSKNDVKNIKISVDSNLQNFKAEDDIFADIFKEKVKDDIPDVEVASISSDDTLPYEIPSEYVKESESGFVSEDQKSLEVSKIDGNHEKNKEAEIEISKNVTNDEKSENPVDSAQILADVKRKLDEKLKKLQEKSVFTEIISNEPIPSTSKSQLEIVPEKIPPNKKSEEILAKINEKLTENLQILEKPSNHEEKVIEIIDEIEQPPKTIEIIDEIQQPQPSTSKSSPEKTLLQIAHEKINKKTESELREMRDEFENEQKALTHERNKLERVGQSITKSMSEDCKELLRLFGIPYVESPMEAEAQCAFLNLIGLSDGTITDDSDILLFGGKRIYKNFFVQQKMVMEFQLENVEEKFHLDRKKLIQLAMLVGSDYTLGVSGIGAVTALEILAAFPSTPEEDNATNIYQSLVSSLRKFRDWFSDGRKSLNGAKSVLKSKLKNIELSENFPNVEIARAYLEPKVDESKEPFSWGNPDKESLVEYTKNKLGWTRMKTEEILEPVLKKLNEKKQATIKDYFKSQLKKKFHDNSQLSKRVQKALDKMKNGENDEKPEEEVEQKEKVKRPRKRKVDTKCEEVVISSDENDPQPSTSKVIPEKKTKKIEKTEKSPKSSQELFKPKNAPSKRKPKTKNEDEIDDPNEKPSRARKVVKIPDTNPAIPQREKDKAESELAKKKAIEIFKKTKK